MRDVLIDVPFIARKSTRDRVETRARLGIPHDRVAALISFDSLNVRIPIDSTLHEQYTFVKPDAHTLERHGLCYQDVVAAVDVVISKPGYGIVSECVANNTALVYVPRRGFAEYALFVAEMPSLLRCRLLPEDELISGEWAPAIDAVLRQPPAAIAPRVDGADAVVAALLEVADRGGETR
jgi:L-arabinokinase